MNRRRFLAGSAAMAALTPASMAKAAVPAAFGFNATELGLRPDINDDQSAVLQRAIDRAAQLRVPLLLPPGSYRVRGLRLAAYSKLIGIHGATRLALSGRGTLLAAERADHIMLADLILDGDSIALEKDGALADFSACRDLNVSSCALLKARGTALRLTRCGGLVANNDISQSASTAIHAMDCAGLVISGNAVRDAGNNGIQVWRSEIGDDGTLVADNRIENVRADDGGTGQNGNAINVFRAGNVIVRGNQIRKAAFSAVRGNSASNLQIVNNMCSELGEVALYVEFAFQGAVVANNIVDGAVVGVSVTNFNEGGRLAVVQGNVLRNLGAKDDPRQGIGIAVEADTVVSGNVIEKAPRYGIALGYGSYLRDVNVTGNILRETGIGIAVSVASGAGAAVITDNLIAESKQGAIIGMDRDTPSTGDLARDGAGKFSHLSIAGNRLR